MIKYFVRTTLDRKLDDSYSQIEYELLVDKEHNQVKALIEQYKYISKYDCVVLEDDLILCKDFKLKIEKVINQNPNKIIDFFFKPMEYFSCESNIGKDDFHWLQCRYFPKNITDKIAIKIEEKYYDYIKAAIPLTKSCKELCYTVYHYRPCLVQHLDDSSLVSNENCLGYRRTPYFIDYLDELGITYEEARTGENKNKLIRLLREKFKEIDNK